MIVAELVDKVVLFYYLIFSVLFQNLISNFIVDSNSIVDNGIDAETVSVNKLTYYSSKTQFY